MINGLNAEKKLPNMCLVLNGVDLSKKKHSFYYGVGKYANMANTVTMATTATMASMVHTVSMAVTATIATATMAMPMIQVSLALALEQSTYELEEQGYGVAVDIQKKILKKAGIHNFKLTNP